MAGRAGREACVRRERPAGAAIQSPLVLRNVLGGVTAGPEPPATDVPCLWSRGIRGAVGRASKRITGSWKVPMKSVFKHQL